MYCSISRSVNRCYNCNDKYIVMADVDFHFSERFCFDSYAEAWDCFDRIVNHNAYGGFRFVPLTAVILRPKGSSLPL